MFGLRKKLKQLSNDVYYMGLENIERDLEIKQLENTTKQLRNELNEAHLAFQALKNYLGVKLVEEYKCKCKNDCNCKRKRLKAVKVEPCPNKKPS